MSSDAVDLALYSDDPVVRDRARQTIAQRSDNETVAALIACLDAPQRLTRRRAATTLSDIPPVRTRSLLAKTLLKADAPIRGRVAAARILLSQADGSEPLFSEAYDDPEPRVRRACTTPATPRDRLLDALTDPDTEVVARAAQSLLILEEPVDASLLRAQVERLEAPPAPLIRLLARWAPEAPELALSNEAPSEASLDHLRTADALKAVRNSHPVTAAWGLSRLGQIDQNLAHVDDPRLRAAVARSPGMSPTVLERLLEDPDPSVRWYARRAVAGEYDPERLGLRLEPHTNLKSPSARPPYGLRPGDELPEVERVHGAVALCQARFDINLGVAMRSAEAAGLDAVYFVGRGDFVRSPARGADLAIPVHHCEDAAALIRRAREGGYQLVAIQQTAGSVPYHQAEYPPNPLFVVGAEDVGMPADLREAADLNVEIPQYGIIDSLNVATALTVVVFHWRVHASG